jgi:hypothetical protein
MLSSSARALIEVSPVLCSLCSRRHKTAGRRSSSSRCSAATPSTDRSSARSPSTFHETNARLHIALVFSTHSAVPTSAPARRPHARTRLCNLPGGGVGRRTSDAALHTVRRVAHPVPLVDKRTRLLAVARSARSGRRPHCALTGPAVRDRLPSSTQTAGAIAGSAPLPPRPPRACPTRSRHRHPTGRVHWHHHAFSRSFCMHGHFAARPAGHDPTNWHAPWALRAGCRRSLCLRLLPYARRVILVALPCTARPLEVPPRTLEPVSS